MRAALLNELPALTRFYGLRPWEIETLTLEEVAEYRTQMQEYLAAVERANQEARR